MANCITFESNADKDGSIMRIYEKDSGTRSEIRLQYAETPPIVREHLGLHQSDVPGPKTVYPPIHGEVMT